MQMLGFVQISIFLMIGIMINKFANVPIAGSIIGLGLLTAYLLLQNKLTMPSLKSNSSLLQSLLSLFLIPAGVAIISYYDQIKSDLIWYILLIILNAVFTFLVCIYTFKLCMKGLSSRRGRS